MKVSVIIPTYCRTTLLETCLKALSRQQFRGDWEVVLVNDGGDQGELEKLTLKFQNLLNVHLFHQENAGPAAARNFGAEQAEGEFLAFLDDDCLPAPNWLHHLMGSCKKGLMTGGHTQNLLQHNVFAETSQQLVTYLYVAFSDTSWYFFTTNNLMVSREDFFELGGFDTRFRKAAGEDRAFCLAWLSGGRKMKYVEEAIINHQHYLTFRSFWRQHFRYGQAANTYQQCLREKDLKLRPSLKFYFRLLIHPFKQPGKVSRKLAVCLLFILAQFATLSGYNLHKA